MTEKPQTTGPWVKISDRLPPYGEGIRVLIYTDAHDFAGAQFFDVKADDLHQHTEEDERPEVCQYATHWRQPEYMLNEVIK